MTTVKKALVEGFQSFVMFLIQWLVESIELLKCKRTCDDKYFSIITSAYTSAYTTVVPVANWKALPGTTMEQK